MSPGSPAIEAGGLSLLPQDTYDADGDSNTAECFPVDLDGCVRIAGAVRWAALAIPEMGAYETDAAVDPGGTCHDFADFDCDYTEQLDTCEGIEDCDLNGLVDLCEIIEDPGLDVDLAAGLDECQPRILHGPPVGTASFTDHAFTGYIDPRMESTDGINVNLGLDKVTIVFSKHVSASNGTNEPLEPWDFIVTATGTDVPKITLVDDSANPKVVLYFDRIIPLRDWVTIQADVYSTEDSKEVFRLPLGYGGTCDANGNCGPGKQEPDRIDVGYLPADVDQDGVVGPFDLLKFRQYVNGVVKPPAMGVPNDYIDMNRNGTNGVDDPPDVFDLLVLRQLVNGVSPPATQVWNGLGMNEPQP